MTDTAPDREAALAGFLESAGWGGAERRLLAADASFRHYDRLRDGSRRAVLMNAPPDKEPVGPFLAVQEILLRLGLSAPKLLAAAPAEGLLLLEDLGDRTFTRALAEGEREEKLYRLATDLLIALHRRWQPELGAGLAPYDEAALLREALLFVEWYLPAASGRPCEPAAREAFVAAWRSVLAEVAGRRDVLVLRDYHVDNLMLLPAREGAAACGLLDFQDALLGARAYDLVSLLEDARRDVPAPLAAAMTARYLAAFPQLDRDAFAADYAVLGVQRSTKILGIFVRLDRRDGKPRYLAHLPRLWRLVEQGLSRPALAPVAAWFARWAPAELRDPPASAPAQGVPR